MTRPELFHVLILLVTGIGLLSCTSSPEISPPDTPVEELAEGIGTDVDVQYTGDRVSLVGESINARFTPGARQFVLNGDQKSLSEPAYFRGDHLYVPAGTRRYISEVRRNQRSRQDQSARETSSTPGREADPFTVVIDPGHGGHDTGAIGMGNLREKRVVLSISRKVNQNINQDDINVHLTRERDRSMGNEHNGQLDHRVEIAARHEADLFISIHANAATTPSARGAEIFIARPSDRNDNISRLTDWYRGSWSVDGNRSAREAARERYRTKRKKTKQAARIMKQNMTQTIPTPFRGIKRRSFHVLRESPAPALLVETGFLTNQREAALLKDPSYQEKLARSIATAIHQIQQRFETQHPE